MSDKQRVEIDFTEWLGLVCKYEPLAYQQLLCIGLLMIAASFLMMHNAVVGLSLFFGLGVAFTWAFRLAWLRSMENPPWYMRGTRRCQS